MIWVFGLWTCYKEAFASGGTRRVNQNTVFAIFELLLALFVSRQLNVWSFLLLFSLVLAFNLRQKYPSTVTLTMSFFLMYYLALNSCVNMFDLVWNYAFQGITYQQDSDFVTSFSYKTHQAILIAGLSFVSAQFIRPTVPLLKEVPVGLALIHLFSLILAGSLFVTFLFELTSMAPKTRFKVFRVELVKVFMTLVMFYFISLCFTAWLHG